MSFSTGIPDALQEKRWTKGLNQTTIRRERDRNTRKMNLMFSIPQPAFTRLLVIPVQNINQPSKAKIHNYQKPIQTQKQTKKQEKKKKGRNISYVVEGLQYSCIFPELAKITKET